MTIFVRVFVLALLSLTPTLLLAQSGNAGDAIEIFRGMSPDQQRVILEQMGGGSATSRAGSSDSGSATDRARPRNSSDRNTRGANAEDSDREPLIPVLRPGDSLLIQVEPKKRRFVPDAPGTPSQPGSQSSQQQLQQQPSLAQGAPAGLLQQQGGSWVEPEKLSDEQQRSLDELMALIRARNPYQLDANGGLTLPGFSGIALGGLTELQAAQRLSAEPVLMSLDIKVVRLPLAKQGLDALKRFGYDLFEGYEGDFDRPDLPVPADYVVGPGDELQIQLYGNQNRNLRLTVGRDGRVSFPELGPIGVSGQSFSRVKADIEARVERQLIGTRASVGIGEIRGISVFVLGEAKRPGTYSVSGLATITTALYASGGVKPIGSLRNIQLKRQGSVVRTLDLYDMLIRGDTSNDAKLQPGDAIFIPPVGQTVSVEGEVHRPAIYELRGESTITQLVQLAGGLTPVADGTRGSLVRIGADARRIVLHVDLNAAASSGQGVRNGDALRIPSLRPTIDSGVELRGAVFRTGPFAFTEGMRLTDVIGSIDELRPNSDPGYVIIRRELPPDRRTVVVSADLNAALAAPSSDANVRLMPKDQITVFDLAPGRERVIKPLMDELRLQAGLEQPTQVVRIEGKVKVPGEYPLEPGMRVSDLLRAGGNLNANAYGGRAELARYRVTDGQSRQTELMEIDLAAVRRGDPAANLTLAPFDYLLIKETPDWGDQEAVTLEGEVRFPGTYPIRRGETMHQLLIRAGGLTTLSFPRGAAFTRKELKEREQKQLDMLTERLKGDVASLSLQAAAANQAGASSALTAGQSLLTQLQESQAVGRLVIDLPGIMSGEPGSARDVILNDGDRLIVPKQRQEVTVIGEVQSVTSHLYRAGLDRDDYLSLSGGLTRKADRDKIYVVRTDGSVVASNRSLFRRSYEVAIMPGDTIVVPLNAERIPKLPFWQAVTQIIYNLAVSVAAINSF